MSIFDSIKSESAKRPVFVSTIVALVIVAILVTIYFTAIRSPYKPLFNNMRAAEAAAVVAELDKKKIPYRLEDGGATILVPAKVVDVTRLGVLSEDLPLKGMVGFELFNKSDMGLTEFAQQINYHRALQGELARTIMALDTVESARVHLMVAEPTVFRDDRRPSKASVTLVARAGRQISENSVRGIQRLVAAAVPDLEAADVVIIDEQGQVISGSVPEAAPSPVDPAREAAEQYLAAEIQAELKADFPGVTATVSIGAGQAQPAVGTAGPPEDLLAVWWSGSRTFPLRVTLTPPEPQSPEAERKMGELAAAALRLDPALGDSWTVASKTSPAPSAPPPAIGEPAPASPLPATEVERDRFPSPKLFAGVILAVIALAALAVSSALRQQRTPTSAPMSDQQKAAYINQLKSLLDREEDGADAAHV